MGLADPVTLFCTRGGHAGTHVKASDGSELLWAISQLPESKLHFLAQVPGREKEGHRVETASVSQSQTGLTEQTIAAAL